ncbi:MAG: hypothetical protein GXO66_08365 [Euryarchaeota archaeon]|nr:hypothetical protein [Euryarchaeota archaeon]
MDEEQRALVERLSALLDELKALEGDYHTLDRGYMRLLREMERLASRISDSTLREMEEGELRDMILALRLKGSWQTFHSFRL